jgi:hypothetical protein
MNQQEEAVCFYHELGIAVTMWAQVERALLDVVLCTEVLRPNSAIAPQAFGDAFFSIQNFRSKLAFVGEIVTKSVNNAKLLEAWALLFKRCEQASIKRNDLAHRYVGAYPQASPGRRMVLLEWNPKVKSPKIEPNPGTPPTHGIGVRGVIAYRLEFLALTYSLENFAARVSGAMPELFPKSHEQPSDPPTIRTIASQMHAMLGHPPKPSRRES